MADTFANYTDGLHTPASNATLLTTSDSADLVNTSRGLYIGTAGNMKVTMLGGTTLLFTGLAAGSILPIRATRVWATTTTASTIINLF